MHYLKLPSLEVSGHVWASPWHACEKDWMKPAREVPVGTLQATHPFGTLFAKYTHGLTSQAEA
eukprot:7210940-Pyramimonas_sp.AAC.1